MREPTKTHIIDGRGCSDRLQHFDTDGRYLKTNKCVSPRPFYILEPAKTHIIDGLGCSNRLRHFDTDGRHGRTVDALMTLLVSRARTCKHNANAGLRKQNRHSKAHAAVLGGKFTYLKLMRRFLNAHPLRRHRHRRSVGVGDVVHRALRRLTSQDRLLGGQR